MKRAITRTQGDKFCTAEIEIDNGRLSVCGVSGRVLKRAAAKREALARWISYFEDQPGEIIALGKRFGKRLSTARGAARFVLKSDGELHGLDVSRETDSGVYVTESCGQIREELLAFFPEIAPLFPWHLNDMKAGCEHQDALGWGRGHDVVVEPCNGCGGSGVAPFYAGTFDEENCSQCAGAATERKVYKDSIGAPCPTCGYCYGTAWLKRELPPEIVILAGTVGAKEAA